MEQSNLPVTVEALDQLVKEMVEIDAKIDAFNESIKEQNKLLMPLKQKAAGYLRELNRKDYVNNEGFKIKQIHRWSVTVPKDIVAKTALFDYMRERGLYDNYATINARSFQSFYMAEWDAAKKRGEGMEFSLPGVEPAKLFEDLGLESPRKKKEKENEE